MKKLYYSFIVLLVVFVGLVLPRAKAAGDVDLTVSHIGYIDSLQTNSTGDIVGAYVYITESYQSDIMYDVGYYFNLQYFQPDITLYGYDLIGKPLIWNPFDDRGALQKGAWWLLIDYQQMLEDIVDKYYDGYDDGFEGGHNSGYATGYQDGEQSGFNDGYLEGYGDGEQVGYANGYSDGYDDGHDDGRDEVLNSISEIDREILYQDIVLPNGVKDEIIDNEILVDRVGVAIFDGSENWGRYLFDVEPYNTIAFIKVDTLSSVYEKGLSHYISNILMNGYVWNTDDADRIIISELGYVLVRLAKSDLVVYGYEESMTDQQKVNVFKSWLAAQKDAGEPLTVWYEYAEPEQYDLISLLRNEDGSFKDGYNEGYNDGRVHVQRENKSLLSVIPTTIGSIWLMVSDFLSFEVFGINLWAILIVFASFSLLVVIIKMVI